MNTTRAMCHTLIAAGLLAFGACDLNPQPLPPGDTADGGVTSSPTTGTGASSGGTGTSSGSFGGASSSGSSSGFQNAADAGVGGDAAVIIVSEAGLDGGAGPGDAGVDAEAGSTDTGSNDGEGGGCLGEQE
jgi:hypothetical protein